jgi:hypothetical protein
MDDYFLILLALNSFFVVLLVIRFIYRYSTVFQKKIGILSDKLLIISGVIAYSIYAGLRPLGVGTDTNMYANIFRDLSTLPFGQESSVLSFQTSFLFGLLNHMLKWSSVNTFFFIVALMFNTTLCMAISSLFKYIKVEVIFSYFFSFFYYTFLLNGIRNGLAVGFIFLYIVTLLNHNHSPLKKYALLLTASLIHVSSLIFPIANYLVTLLKLNIWKNTLFVSVISLLSFLGYNVFLVISTLILENSGEFVAHKLSFYINSDEYKIGFRFDFFLMGLFFIFIPWVYKVIFYEFADSYKKTVSIYAIIIATQFLFFTMPGNDRIGILGWMLGPIIVLYPFDSSNITFNKRLTILIGLILWLIISMPFVNKYNFQHNM